MKILLILIFPLLAAAQTSGAERQTLQSLLVEVHQLRLALERSTLLGTRTQIALQRIQMQQSVTAQLSQELETSRRQLEKLQEAQPQVAQRITELEDRLPQISDTLARKEAEGQIKGAKLALERIAATEQQQRAREAALQQQIHAEQSRLNELHDRVNEMERALDVAIRQLAGGR